MSLVVPQGSQVQILKNFIGQSGGLAAEWVLKLYSNNRTPAVTDVVGDYTAVAGGGYANITLDKDEFTITPGNPSVALYSDFQDFEFTGATNAPSTIYGYFIIDANGNLVLAQRFPDESVPFVPVNGSLIRVKPRITNASAA